MKELSLHILDIVQNSIAAKANLIRITITEDIQKDYLDIEISDNGCGMSAEFLETVTNPFSTTRTTRKVGMGLSLLKHAAESCGGYMKISSELGVGTDVKARFKHSHIDRQPLGNMSETILTLISCSNEIDYIYTHNFNNKIFIFDTCQIKQILGDIDINNIEIVLWLKEYIKEGLGELT